MKTILVLLIALSVVGCSGNANIKAQVAGANIEIARARAEALRQPLVDVRIPVPNCLDEKGKQCMMLVVVRQQTGGGHDYAPTPDDPWARVAERLVGGLVTASGIYLGGQAAENIVRGTSAGIVDALRTQPAPTVVMQPPAVVVPPAEPVIVHAPAPVIVPPTDPVIIDQPILIP